MSPPASNIDTHCHLLPALDDGPPDETTALAMLRNIIKAGYRRVIATPHDPPCQPKDIIAATDGINQLAQKQNIPLQILPGSEVGVTFNLTDHSLLTLANRGKHVLIELPLLQPYPQYLPDLVFQLGLKGLQVIIAHPERTACFQHDPARLTDLLKQQVLFQLTAASFTGLYGRQIKHFAREILKKGQAHLIATDAHSPDSRRLIPFASTYNLVEKLTSATTARSLLLDNPEKVWQGETI